MSYAWQPIEQAKENGLFKKFEWFWIYKEHEHYSFKPRIIDYFSLDAAIKLAGDSKLYIAPIPQRPAPKRILHTGKITEDK